MVLQVPLLSSTFITNGEITAITKSATSGQFLPHTIGQLQCQTIEDAKSSNCTLASNVCICSVAKNRQLANAAEARLTRRSRKQHFHRLRRIREDVLLHREDLHSLDDRYTIEFVIAHELAHQAFLNKYSYDAVEAYELYEAWYEAGLRAKKTFKNISTFVDFCQEWTDQIGFPLITVKSVNDSTFEVTQERYKKDPTEADPPEYNISPWYNFRWDVPLWYQLNDEPEKMNWLEIGKPLYIPANTASTTIVVNVDRYGFYRQNYDLEGWKKIGKQLLQKHTVYSLRTRNAIISDAFAAALVDRIEYMTALDLLKYLKEEAEYVPWSAAITGLNQVRSYIGNVPELEEFNIYMRRVLLTIYKKEFFDDLSRNHTDDSKLKLEVIEAICSTGESSCIDEYAKLFEQKVLVKCKEGMRASECVNTFYDQFVVVITLKHETSCAKYLVNQKSGRRSHKDHPTKLMELFAYEKISLEKERLIAGIACHNDSATLKK
ncbi:hypothetical protein TELCIR_09179 [Teladorsagia circumcincta]|uniref:ERAP1-like C-terminal domain-containing protein n=1 Tax=Teladorsagia circumcincta TaxID=45464 RepID=A0A2G9UFQ7_TELCI|nr:hypothetical protein TELCIR_09179 [Teladorsagia circumcincta]